MKKRAPVSQIMTANPITINLASKVTEVVDIFEKNNLHHLPVVSGTNLLGIISKSDIDKISFVSQGQEAKANIAVYDSLCVEQIMTSQVECVQIEDQIRDAAELLATGNYHALPVMEGKELKGIVTSTDVIQYLLEQY